MYINFSITNRQYKVRDKDREPYIGIVLCLFQWRKYLEYKISYSLFCEIIHYTFHHYSLYFFLRFSPLPLTTRSDSLIIKHKVCLVCSFFRISTSYKTHKFFVLFLQLYPLFFIKHQSHFPVLKSLYSLLDRVHHGTSGTIVET